MVDHNRLSIRTPEEILEDFNGDGEEQLKLMNAFWSLNSADAETQAALATQTTRTSNLVTALTAHENATAREFAQVAERFGQVWDLSELITVLRSFVQQSITPGATVYDYSSPTVLCSRGVTKVELPWQASVGTQYHCTIRRTTEDIPWFQQSAAGSPTYYETEPGVLVFQVRSLTAAAVVSWQHYQDIVAYPAVT